jgi:hypothetical protein
MHVEVDESRNDETPFGRDSGRARRRFHAPADLDDFALVDHQVSYGIESTGIDDVSAFNQKRHRVEILELVGP